MAECQASITSESTSIFQDMRARRASHVDSDIPDGPKYCASICVQFDGIIPSKSNGRVGAVRLLRKQNGLSQHSGIRPERIGRTRKRPWPNPGMLQLTLNAPKSNSHLRRKNLMLTKKETIMPTPIRVGILGLTHDHIWGNLDDLNNSSMGELVAAADPNGPLLEKIRDEYGCEQVFESYEAMLDEVESGRRLRLRRQQDRRRADGDGGRTRPAHHGREADGLDIGRRGRHGRGRVGQRRQADDQLALCLESRPFRRPWTWPWRRDRPGLRDQISLRPCRSQGVGLHTLLLQLAA